MAISCIFEVERALYGTETTVPKVLSVDEFENMSSTAADIVVVDHGDGTWSATSSDYYIKRNLGAGQFTIKEADALYLTPDKYALSSTE